MSGNRGLIEEARRKAHNYDRYSGCSQSVLGSLQETLKIGNIESFKAATVLSGGVARQGETCGALLGALSALGLVIGRERIGDTEQYRKAMGPARELCEGFKDALRVEFGFEGKLGSTLCREIQEKIYGRSFDLNKAEDYRAFIEAGGHGDDGCLKVCGIAAQVGAEKILEILRNR
jgi:C_GCAxxG_C_C family probable redox protein